MGFPKSVCATLNEACCHGIPDERPLQNGDYFVSYLSIKIKIIRPLIFISWKKINDNYSQISPIMLNF